MLPQTRHVRRDRVRYPCCDERIARTANVEPRIHVGAVISIDEIVRCAQYLRPGARCFYATPAVRRSPDALRAAAYRFRKTLVGPCDA
ncbi:hypothetical protein F3J12_10680 [Burkholderia sp. Ax-1735]|nr:hypothetical protein [Burkholderia sp. Ap-955]NIF10004.1 hypothetical protein [Burkholderia sp. Ax-1735]NIG03338.1 hypothetical protein [Burkholderia sp. Tr-849]